MKPRPPKTIAELRAWAVASAFPPAPVADLQAAIEQTGFIQADPIRAPARAQDLILRHRVKDGSYCAGDLERRYPELDLEEDYLYAYGFLAREAWRWAHPKPAARLTKLEQRVRDVVREDGEMHPARLEERLGQSFRAVNAWGGMSKASTRALDHLHFYGLLRIKRRERGVRVYAPALAHEEPEPAAARLKALLKLAIRNFAPVPEASAKQILRHLAYAQVSPERARAALAAMVAAGEFERHKIEGMNYLWPADLAELNDDGEAGGRVRILAPFDPLVWDRRRFEHLWNWTYRFEAYTPVAKRKLGYYAMPLLWRDEVVGWVNASAGAEGRQLTWSAGYVSGGPPKGRKFAEAFRAELARLAGFLGCDFIQ